MYEHKSMQAKMQSNYVLIRLQSFPDFLTEKKYRKDKSNENYSWNNLSKAEWVYFWIMSGFLTYDQTQKLFWEKKLGGLILMLAKGSPFS